MNRKMQRYFIKSPIIFIVITLSVQTVAGNYINFAESLRLKRPEEIQFDSSFEDVNAISDYSAELHSPTLQRNREWMNVTMSQGSHSLMRGQSYELKCEAVGKPAPEIHWIRGREVSRQINELKRKTRACYSCNKQELDLSKVESKYLINCVTDADAGPIHCVAISDRFIEKKTTIIKIDGPSLLEGSCNIAHNPVITKFRPTLLSVQGSTVILPCDVSGNPRPETFWQIEGDNGAIDLENNPRFHFLRNGGLLIESLEWKDLGKYVCIANSTLGEDRVATFVYPLQSTF